MKTWEMYKALLENPKKKFKMVNSTTVYCLSEKNFLQPEEPRDRNFLATHLPPDVEWEEVKEPVPWQEAIQAWIDGETICVECYDSHESPIEMDIDATGDAFYLMKHMFTKGKWYIK